MQRFPKHISLCCMFCFLFSTVGTLVFCQTYEELLDGYIARDRELDRLSISVEKAELALRKFELETGFDIALSSGTVQTSFNSSGVSLNAIPSISVSMPLWNNSSFTTTVPFTAGRGGNGIGTQLGVQTDIFSGANALHGVNRQVWERALQVAHWNLMEGKAIAEKVFLEKLKKLYGYRIDVLSARLSVDEAVRDFEVIRAQGYGESSSRYRSAQLKVRSKVRAVQESERLFERELAAFGILCGYPSVLLPEDIPDVVLLTIQMFPRTDFKELENASWTNYINKMQRKASSYPFTLRGSAGYSYSGNVSGLDSSLPSAADEHALSAGLTAGFYGVSVSAGISIPVTGKAAPTATFSLGWDLRQSKSQKISDRVNELTALHEQLDIRKAESNYDSAVTDFEKRRDDLLWQESVFTEEFTLYEEQLRDVREWYDKGVLRESDYMKAETDYELARMYIVTTLLEKKLYNLDLSLLFVRQ